MAKDKLLLNNQIVVSISETYYRKEDVPTSDKGRELTGGRKRPPLLIGTCGMVKVCYGVGGDIDEKQLALEWGKLVWEEEEEEEEVLPADGLE